MKKRMLVCVCAGCAQLIAGAETINWTGGGGNTLFTNEGNWSIGRVPVQGDIARVQATDMTITFPAGGYVDKSCTEVDDRASVTFDTRGTFWLKPADSTWGNPTFRIGGGPHGFNIESVNSAKAQMLFSNAVLRASATASEVSTTLESGFFNFYNPDGIDSGNSVVIGHDTARRHVVTLEPGATSLWKTVHFRAKGTDNLIRINGGRHEISQEFRIVNDTASPGKTGLVHIVGGELLTHYYCHLGASPGKVGRVLIGTNGQWTSRQTIEMGQPGYGVLDIAGGTLWQDASAQSHNLHIGHAAGSTGVVNVIDGRLINTNNQILVGRSSVGFLNQSGGRVDSRYTHVGADSSATGTLHISGGTWVNTGNGSVGNNGYGEMIVSGGSFSVDNEWFAVAMNASAVGRLTLAGGNTSFLKFMVGRNDGEADSGDGILTITGGTNRFNEFQLGNKVCTRSLARVGGGTNDFRSNEGICVGMGGHGEMEIFGGIVTTPQIRVGMNSNKVNEISCLTVSGGFVRVAGVINVGDNPENSGRMVFNGGVVEAETLRGWRSSPAQGSGGTGTAVLYADGGTVRANRTPPTGSDPDIVYGFNTAALGSRGLVIDTANFTTRAAQVFSNQAGASGTLTKIGTGTLTLSGASTHAVTVVADGTLIIAGSGTIGDNAIVTNGATLSLAGASTGLMLQTITLGDANTSGWLDLDPGDTITITEADGLRLPFARIRLADTFGDNTYPIFSCAGSVTLAALQGLEVANPKDGKAYTFAVNYDSGLDATDVTLSIQNKSSVTVTPRVWDGDSGGAWGTGGNWTGNTAPQAGEAAIFPDGASTKNVVLTVGATAGALSLESSSGGYMLTGTDTLTLDNNGAAGAINVLSGSHTVSAPLALMRTVAADVAQGAEVSVSGAVSGHGGIIKTGDGTMRLVDANTFTGSITAGGGMLDIASDDAFGVTSSDRANMVFVSDTLRYSGTPAEKSIGFTVNAPLATNAVVFDSQSDLTLSGIFQNDAGALIKRGAGTLELHPVRESKLTCGDGTVVTNTLVQADLDFNVNGVSPTAGYAGLTIAEGTLRIVGDADTVTRLQHIVFIGARTMQGTAQPALEIDGGTALVGDGSKHTFVGTWTPAGSALTNPAIRVTGGATATFNTINLGYSGNATYYPELLVDGSTIETHWANKLAGQNNGLATTVVRNGGVLATLNNETRLDNAFSILIDNSILATRNTANANGRIIFGGNARGTLAVANGGRMAFPAIIMESSHAEGVRFLFDNGVFQPTMDGTMLFRNDDKHFVEFGAGGGIFEVNDGITYTVARPLTGVGGLTKTGAGTLVLGATLVDAGSVTNATNLTAGDYDGMTRVAAGTLAVSTGTLRSTAQVAVNADATLDLGASPVALGKLSGTGTVTNGTLAAAIIAPGENDGDIATFTVDGLDFTGTTFQCDVVQDENGAVVKNDILDITGPVSGAGFVDFGRTPSDPLKLPTTLTVARYNPAVGTPDVSQWKTRGAGRGSVSGKFSAENGEIRVTVRFSGNTVFILK